MKKLDRKSQNLILLMLGALSILFFVLSNVFDIELISSLFSATISGLIIVAVIFAVQNRNAKPTATTNKVNNSTAHAKHVFRVVGVTFKSEKYHRQDILRIIKKRKHTATLRPYSFKGEDAIGVYADEYQIGNISKDDVSKVKKLITNIDNMKINVYGGESVFDEAKNDYVERNYGAEIVIFVKKNKNISKEDNS